MRTRLVFGGVLVFATLTGCFRRNEAPAAGPGHDVITRAELDRTRDLNLYDAIARMRPSFFRNRSITARGRDPGQPIMVYIDGEKVDGLLDLRHYTPAEVEEVRFYEPAQANVKFGRYNNYGGAIAVILRPSGAF